MYLGLNNLGLNYTSSAFNPMDWFTNSEQGAWYDADNPADGGPVTAYQESTGITPVTAPGQGAADCVIGLLLDKRLGLVLGAELKASGVVALAGAATAATYDTATGVGSVTRVDGANQSYVAFNGLSATATYKITLTNPSAGAIWIRPTGLGTAILTVPAGQTLTGFLAGYANYYITSSGGATQAFTVNSLAQLPGNHATQATAASRPTLSARYNGFIKSEFPAGAADCSAKSATLVTTAATTIPGFANAIAFGHDGVTTAYAYQNFAAATINTNYRFSVYVMMDDGGAPAFGHATVANALNDFYFGLGGASPNPLTFVVTAMGGGVYRVHVDAATGGTVNVNTFGVVKAGANNNRTFKVTGYDIRLAADAALSIPAYQRVTDASNYDTAGFPCFFRFDGFDDSLSTAAVDFTATDKLTAVAGVAKLSDAALGTLVELGATATGTNGAFGIFAPTSAAANYGFITRGIVGSANQIPITYAAPINSVLACSFDHAGGTTNAQIAPRINGALDQEGSTAGPTTAGNYGNLALNIGRRNGATLPLNARLTTLIICGAARNDAQIVKAERYVARKMKVTL
jgi:hypothetical protein